MPVERYTGNKELTRRSAQVAVRFQQRVVTEFEKKHFFPKQARRLKDLLKNPTSILDIGSGTGYFADALKNEMPETLIISTDIENKHKGGNPFVVANSNSLPFADNSFDVVTIFYLLHHTIDPKNILLEAQRVSKDKVIVQEDSYSNGFERFMLNMHIRSYQLGSPLSAISSVHTSREWEDLFKESEFQITQKHRIHKIGYPVTRYEYVLTSLQKKG